MGLLDPVPFPLAADAEAAFGLNTGNASAAQQKSLRTKIGAEPYSDASLPGVNTGFVDSANKLSVTNGVLIPERYGGLWGWALINHIIFYGQSLSEGALAAAISLIQAYSNVMFNTGVRSRTEPSGAYVTPSSFVPLVSTNDSATIGETPVPGNCDGLSYILSQPPFNLTPATHVMMGSSAGRGGQNIGVLRVGGADWTRLRNMMLDSRRLALAANFDYRCMGMGWFHGEADVSSTPSSYATLLVEMQVEGQRLASNLGDTAYDFPIFAYQCTDQATVGTQGSLRGLLSARAQNPSIYISFPKYAMSFPQNGNQFMNTDRVHGTSIGYLMMGWKNAQVMSEVCIKGNKTWKGVEMTGVKVLSNIVYIDYNVPYPPLVLDTTLMGAVQDMGFKVADSSGTLTISSVTVVNGNRIKIVCNRTIVGTVTVGYALNYTNANYTATPAVNAGVGNLRDSDPFKVSYNDGGGADDYFLPNWAIAQDWVLSLN